MSAFANKTIPPPSAGRAAAPKNELLFRFLLVIGSVIFCWALIEFPALINLVDYEGFEFSQVWGSLRFIRVPDPQLLHIEPPYAHYTGTSRGGDFETRFDVPAADQDVYRWDLKYDRNGFRNDSDLKRADIVVIGDSMVEGMTVPDASIATSVLARIEGKVVANLGQYGYGPQQEFAVLNRFALQLEPRTVVWMFFEGNDLTDEAEYREAQQHPPGFWSFFLQRSFTRFAIRRVKRMMTPPRPPGITRSGLFMTREGAARNVYFSEAARPLSAADQTALKETVSLISQARTIASQHGAEFVFVLVPDKFRALHEFLTYPAASECRKWAVNDLPGRLRAALESASPGIGFVDLTPDLAAAARAGVLPYYRDDVHLSETGHRIAAESIDRYLSQSRPH